MMKLVREALQLHRLQGDKRRSLAVDAEGGHPLNAGFSVYLRARASNIEEINLQALFIPGYTEHKIPKFIDFKWNVINRTANKLKLG